MIYELAKKGPYTFRLEMSQIFLQAFTTITKTRKTVPFGTVKFLWGFKTGHGVNERVYFQFSPYHLTIDQGPSRQNIRVFWCFEIQKMADGTAQCVERGGYSILESLEDSEDIANMDVLLNAIKDHRRREGKLTPLMMKKVVTGGATTTAKFYFLNQERMKIPVFGATKFTDQQGKLACQVFAAKEWLRYAGLDKDGQDFFKFIFMMSNQKVINFLERTTNKLGTQFCLVSDPGCAFLIYKNLDDDGCLNEEFSDLILEGSNLIAEQETAKESLKNLCINGKPLPIDSDHLFKLLENEKPALQNLKREKIKPDLWKLLEGFNIQSKFEKDVEVMVDEALVGAGYSDNELTGVSRNLKRRVGKMIKTSYAKIREIKDKLEQFGDSSAAIEKLCRLGFGSLITKTNITSTSYQNLTDENHSRLNCLCIYEFIKNCN
tara:strand:- start:2285 stop:3586 length:1302 start_codon:yes stop_codon:yes gene_type:complete